MIYTHFKLTEFGERTAAIIDGIPALIDTWYEKDKILYFEKFEPGTVGEPYDKAKYMVTDGTVNSNTANIIISFPPNRQITAVGSNATLEAAQNTLYDVFDYATYNEAVDRIKIVDFTLNGELTFEGSNIYPNFVMMQYDFKKLQFKTFTGTGLKYQSIKYQVGNINGYNPTVYEVNFNLSELATLKNFSNSVETLEGISYYYGELEVLKGVPFSTVKISTTTNFGSGPWATPSENAVYINEVEGIGNITRDVFMVLDQYGKATLHYSVLMEAAFLPVTGTIDFTLSLMNYSTDFISPTEFQVTENINL